LTPTAAQQLDGSPKSIHGRVQALLVRLANWPEVNGAKALTGVLAGWYRMRTGDYRHLFRVRGETVIVEKIGHQRDFYED
jgi:mRNA-degrading endonuclease RelE of RelBE toxin-antitoxin system